VVRSAGLQEITRDPEISRAMFDILEAQQILDSKADITLIPKGNDLLKQITATESNSGNPPPEANR